MKDPEKMKSIRLYLFTVHAYGKNLRNITAKRKENLKIVLSKSQKFIILWVDYLKSQLIMKVKENECDIDIIEESGGSENECIRNITRERSSKIQALEFYKEKTLEKSLNFVYEGTNHYDETINEMIKYYILRIRIIDEQLYPK